MIFNKASIMKKSILSGNIFIFNSLFKTWDSVLAIISGNFIYIYSDQQSEYHTSDICLKKAEINEFFDLINNILILSANGKELLKFRFESENEKNIWLITIR